MGDIHRYGPSLPPLKCPHSGQKLLTCATLKKSRDLRPNSLICGEHLQVRPNPSTPEMYPTQAKKRLEWATLKKSQSPATAPAPGAGTAPKCSDSPPPRSYPRDGVGARQGEGSLRGYSHRYDADMHSTHTHFGHTSVTLSLFVGRRY